MVFPFATACLTFYNIYWGWSFSFNLIATNSCWRVSIFASNYDQTPTISSTHCGGATGVISFRSLGTTYRKEGHTWVNLSHTTTTVDLPWLHTQCWNFVAEVTSCMWFVCCWILLLTRSNESILCSRWSMEAQIIANNCGISQVARSLLAREGSNCSLDASMRPLEIEHSDLLGVPVSYKLVDVDLKLCII